MKAPTAAVGPADAAPAEEKGKRHYGSGEPPPPRGSDSFTARVRAAIAARVESHSLRSVAREIGMSATGLSKFLDGNAPYTPTLNRLRNWYLRHATPQGDLSRDDAHAALALLVHDLVPEARHAAVDEMVRCMREGYQASGQTPPAWLEEMPGRFPLPVEPPPRRHRLAPGEDDA